ncbi:MAG: cell wall-binding repeat-containing protein [Candidatus Nitrosocosmicus sp.]
MNIDNNKKGSKIVVSAIVSIGAILGVSLFLYAINAPFNLDGMYAALSNPISTADQKSISLTSMNLKVQAQEGNNNDTENDSDTTSNTSPFNLKETAEESNYLATSSTTRIAGNDYYSTATAISQMIYPAINDYTRPNAVILVSVDEPAVALTSVGIIHHPIDAPILYTDKDKLPEVTKEEIKRLKPDGIPVVDNAQVMMIGNISDNVYNVLSKEMGLKIFRITGDTPIDISSNVDEFMSTMHTDHRDEIMIANVDSLDYALYAQAWNAHMGHGFLYVTDKGIPEPTRQQLEKRFGGAYIYLLGDEKVISQKIADELAQYGHVTRIPGNNPFEMSAKFAGFKDMGNNYGFWIGEMARNFGWGLAEAGHNFALVNPDHPQDAVPASILSHRGKHGPMLLVNENDIPKPIEGYLKTVQPSLTDSREQLFNHGWIIGPPSHISVENQAKLDYLLSPLSEQQQAQAQTVSAATVPSNNNNTANNSTISEVTTSTTPVNGGNNSR